MHYNHWLLCCDLLHYSYVLFVGTRGLITWCLLDGFQAWKRYREEGQESEMYLSESGKCWWQGCTLGDAGLKSFCHTLSHERLMVSRMSHQIPFMFRELWGLTDLKYFPPTKGSLRTSQGGCSEIFYLWKGAAADYIIRLRARCWPLSDPLWGICMTLCKVTQICSDLDAVIDAGSVNIILTTACPVIMGIHFHGCSLRMCPVSLETSQLAHVQ